MFDSSYQQLIQGAEDCSIRHYSARAIVRRDGRLLLLKRAAGHYLGGLYELPGGKKRKNENLGKTAKRELREETGLWPAGELAYVGYFDSSRRDKRVREFVFLVDATGSIVLNKKEHAEYAWTGKSDLENYPLIAETRDFLLSRWDSLFSPAPS